MKLLELLFLETDTSGAHVVIVMVDISVVVTFTVVWLVACAVRVWVLMSNVVVVTVSVIVWGGAIEHMEAAP